jgi:hypothetical protein
LSDLLPPPLVPAEVDLRDFAFMPLDVQRLRDSDLTSEETPEACWAAVLLWCAAWHQVPAASIPDSDQWQAKHTGYVSRGRVDPQCVNVKRGALRGWVACSDGRLYHPVIAEKAIDAWRSKLAQRHRAECARIKKHNQRHGTAVPYPDLDAWILAGCPSGPLPIVPGDSQSESPGTQKGSPQTVPRETPSKGQGEGEGQGLGEKNPSGSSSAEQTLPGIDKPPAGGQARPTIPCPYGAIVDAYHAALPNLPTVQLRDGPTWKKREKAMREMWGWVLSSRRPDGTRRAETAEQALTWFGEYFARAAENDFVMGRTKPSAEHANWRADFDYLLSPKGMKQVIEKTQEAA